MIKSLKDATSSQAYFHTNLKYVLIFWGGDSKSKTIFKLQKESHKNN
jgi:hypothetical protein